MADFETFWSIYPSDLCGGSKNKGGKNMALKSWEKHVTDPGKVILALQAQIRYDKDAKSKGEWVPRWPMATTWLNQGKWDLEIDSHSELRQKHEAKYCSMENCNAPVHGPRFNYCGLHLCLDIQGRFKDNLLVPEIRAYYEQHKEIHGLTGKDARQWINGRMRK